MRLLFLLITLSCSGPAAPEFGQVVLSSQAHHVVLLNGRQGTHEGLDVRREETARYDPHDVIEASAPFDCDEVVPSWNLRAKDGESLVVELSVCGEGGAYSPWLVVGHLGAIPEEQAIATSTTCVWGRTEHDTFLGTRPFRVARLRLRRWDGTAVEARLEQAAFCFSRRRTEEEPSFSTRPVGRPSDLAVPFRSQRDEAPELATRICSPTSVAMVLEYYGISVPTAAVARRIHDEAHDLYGNWSRAVQVAFELGLSGYVARFDDWGDVERVLASGTPLVISVRVEPGELPGAAFEASQGHLLVLRGLTQDGRALVNDPAFPDAERGRTSYAREDLERVWFERRRGTAYVLERPR